MSEIQTLSASLEDYLEAIYHIVSSKGAAKVKDIAKRLKVASSSVTGAMHLLSKKGLVNYMPYDIVTLTPDGEIAALDVIRRHVALRNFLISVLEISDEKADEAACKMEHSISNEILERLILFVKFVNACPLGGAKWVEGEGFFCEAKGTGVECPLWEKYKKD